VSWIKDAVPSKAQGQALWIAGMARSPRTSRITPPGSTSAHHFRTCGLRGAKGASDIGLRNAGAAARHGGESFASIKWAGPFLSLTPAPPPCSAMNSTSADSRAVADREGKLRQQVLARAIGHVDPGFGVFSTKQRRACTGRSPRTGDDVLVTEKHMPAFRTGKEVCELLNRR
jgi:hypothetical protein